MVPGGARVSRYGTFSAFAFMRRRSRRSRSHWPRWLLLLIAVGAAALVFWPSQDFNPYKVSIDVPQDDRRVLALLDSIASANPKVGLNLLRFGAMVQGDFVVPAGYYEIAPRDPWWRSLHRLRMGYETPRRLVVRAYQARSSLVRHLASVMHPSPSEFDVALFQGDSCVPLLPNTYEVYASLSPQEFADRMGREFDAFWNANRMESAAALNLTRYEATILASIVQAESKEPQEWSRIAGVYLSRLRKGMRLEADPTVVFAVLDRKLAPEPIRRVTGTMLRLEHPYNTYHSKGLPPGPLATVHPPVIDSVLVARPNGELFFCANPSKQGFHLFAKTYAEHLAYRKRYLSFINK